MKMASTGSHWEVVGKQKKGKPSGQDGRKSQKKILAENMPRIETAPPVKESPTIYDAFRDKAARNEKPSGKEQVKPTDVIVNGKKPSASKKKVAAGGEKKTKVTLEEAAKKIDVNELETMLAKDQTTFPDSPSVWLKDLASVLNLRLDMVPENDPLFEEKPKEYPLCVLGKPVRQLLVRTLNQCSTKTLELFFEHCLHSMINDMGKGTSTYGYRMLIQLLAFDKPDIVIANLKKALELIRSHQNRPLRCLSIMWAVGQAGNNSLAKGLTVWLEVMLPVLNMRALSGYSVAYLDHLFSIHKKLPPAYNVIGFRNFFPILDMIFKPNSSLPTHLQKNLQALYPKIKILSFGSEPSAELRNFFPSFLARAEPSTHGQLKAEVMRCLVECLTVDKHCFSVWRQMYTKHLTQSSELLQHLVDVVDTSNIDRKVLKDTIRAFHITNEELSTKGKSGGEGYTQCVSSCQVLLQKLSGMRFPWRLVLFLLLATVTGLLAFDIYDSQGFHKSRTNKFLEDTGILIFLEQVWQRITLYSGKAWEWLREHVPLYYARTCEFVGPYLVMGWEKCQQAGVWVVNVTKPQVDWVYEKTPQAIEWIQTKAPTLYETCSYYAFEAWHFTLEISMWLWHHTVDATHATAMWLRENVFTGSLSPENLQKTFLSLLTTIQTYSSSFFQWCTQMWYGPADAK